MCTKLLKILMLIVVTCSFFVPYVQAQAAAGPTTETPSYIVVYKDEGFHGESEKFLVGQYATLESRWKDQIKSVALVGSVRATLFDKEQFGGKKVVAEQSLYKLPGDMRGETASLIVEPFSCAYAIAYKDTTYRGESRQFPVGEYPKMSDGWDNTESMELCGQVSVTLFTKSNFEGDTVTINTDRIDLGKFRKKVKSMKVEAHP
jgi:hypothetical protein